MVQAIPLRRTLASSP